MIKNCWG